MSDGPGDDWENLLDSGELDQKLNDIKIEKNGSSKSDGGTNLSDPDFSGPIKILTNDSRHMLMSRKQEPTMKILKRPDSNNSKQTETQAPKAMPKSLSQREAEYAEARQRILGAEAASGASSSGSCAQPTAGQTAPAVATSKSGSVQQTTSSGKQNSTTAATNQSSGGNINNNNNRQNNHQRGNSGSNHNHNKRNNSHPPHHQMQHLPPVVRPNLQQPPPHGVAQLPGNFIIPGGVAPHTMYPPPPLINGGALGPTHFPPQFSNGHGVQQRNSHYPPQYPPPRGMPDGQGAQQPYFKLRR